MPDGDELEAVAAVKTLCFPLCSGENYITVQHGSKIRMHMIKSLLGQTVASAGNVDSEKHPSCSAEQSDQTDTFCLSTHARDALSFSFTVCFDVQENV